MWGISVLSGATCSRYDFFAPHCTKYNAGEVIKVPNTS